MTSRTEGTVAPRPANLPELIRDSGFRDLPIRHDHAVRAARLPLIHRDPFDRMLVAQAACEDLTLVTRDPHCQKYDIAVLPACVPVHQAMTRLT
jgi:PIN domain nuclease of toxin-antitoxin system